MWWWLVCWWVYAAVIWAEFLKQFYRLQGASYQDQQEWGKGLAVVQCVDFSSLGSRPSCSSPSNLASLLLSDKLSHTRDGNTSVKAVSCPRLYAALIGGKQSRDSRRPIYCEAKGCILHPGYTVLVASLPCRTWGHSLKAAYDFFGSMLTWCLSMKNAKSKEQSSMLMWKDAFKHSAERSPVNCKL